jgi:hypothetical protein
MLRQTKKPTEMHKRIYQFQMLLIQFRKEATENILSIVFASAQSAPHEVVNPITIFGFIKLKLDIVAPRL